MMRIAIAQLNYHIGNFEFNIALIKENIQKALLQKADLIVFAELAICGYPPRDFLDFDDFILKSTNAINDIALFCDGISAIVGGPCRNPDKEGKDLFNSAYFLSEGKIKEIIHKTLLPTYDVFDEYRYFEPNRLFRLVQCKGVNLAITICEDLWNINENPLYIATPMEELCKLNPDLVINIAASPFANGHAAERQKVYGSNALKYKTPLLYVNHVGAHTELIFDGGSFALNADATIESELSYFKPDFAVLNFDSRKKRFFGVLRNTPQNPVYPHEPQTRKFEFVCEALILGIKDYFSKQGYSKAILGLSGGIDSALVAVLACKALGPSNVTLVLMPSPFSSDHSIIDATELADILGAERIIIPITEVMNAIEFQLENSFQGLAKDVTEENIQARIRAIYLMAISNKFGCILLNTSNKSELAVGYGTLYGDMCGGLSVIGDLYKTEVYELASYINRNETVIPFSIINKQPSAELRPDQFDTDSLPPYEILDKILFHYIEESKSPKDIIALGIDISLVERILGMVNRNEYKRYQTPPILRVSSKAFGMGRRMPIVAKYLS
jgi:NAD+ synthase (glutamine-hydrolysing)